MNLFTYLFLPLLIALTFMAAVTYAIYPQQTVEFLWRRVARVLAHPEIAKWLIARAMKTPYRHLPGYMDRFWLFNPYQRDAEGKYVRRNRFMELFPSVRVHHILREDTADHPHDHPWDARTVILQNFYTEIRGKDPSTGVIHQRFPGDTATIKFGEYHHISFVPYGGVWTLFITWEFKGIWGFWKDGRKVPYYEYENLERQS